MKKERIITAGGGGGDTPTASLTDKKKILVSPDIVEQAKEPNRNKEKKTETLRRTGKGIKKTVKWAPK